MTGGAKTDPTIEWLLDGDPAIRWQAERNLVDAPTSVWTASRREVDRVGWGARLLGEQDPDGRWDAGWYSPKWTSTTYTLLLLRRFGLERGDERARAGCRRLLDDARWIDGGVSYWESHTDPELCVNAMVLSVCAHFAVDDPRVDSIADLLLRRRLDDGAWNCRDVRGGRHSSFHTTINTLEALSIWSGSAPGIRTAAALESGVEFLLVHRLHRSHTTGESISDEWLVPHFPPRWHYDTLRGLEFLASIDARRDDRASEAIEILIDRRRPDGRWPKGSQYSGRTFFTMEPGRVAGRWNTLRARRVLRWWEGPQP
jgi:hypothetical protein